MISEELVNIKNIFDELFKGGEILEVGKNLIFT